MKNRRKDMSSCVVIFDMLTKALCKVSGQFWGFLSLLVVSCKEILITQIHSKKELRLQEIEANKEIQLQKIKSNKLKKDSISEQGNDKLLKEGKAKKSVFNRFLSFIKESAYVKIACGTIMIIFLAYVMISKHSYPITTASSGDIIGTELVGVAPSIGQRNFRRCITEDGMSVEIMVEDIKEEQCEDSEFIKDVNLYDLVIAKHIVYSTVKST